MGRQNAWVLALVLTYAAAPAAADRGQGQPAKAQNAPREGKDTPKPAADGGPSDRWKWWLYDRAELGITDQQSRDINDIFEATLPKLRETRHEMERAEAELSKTIKAHKADLATISLLIDRVENARSQNTKLRVLMLYRIDQLLSAEQRVKVDALRARQEAARRERDRDSDRRRRP